MITIGFNMELITVMLMAVFAIYMVSILLANTYVNLSPKAVGSLSAVWYMLGGLTVAFIVGSVIFIYFSAIVIILLMIRSILKLRKSNKTRKKTAQQQGGNNV